MQANIDRMGVYLTGFPKKGDPVHTGQLEIADDDVKTAGIQQAQCIFSGPHCREGACFLSKNQVE